MKKLKLTPVWAILLILLCSSCGEFDPYTPKCKWMKQNISFQNISLVSPQTGSNYYHTLFPLNEPNKNISSVFTLYGDPNGEESKLLTESIPSGCDGDIQKETHSQNTGTVFGNTVNMTIAGNASIGKMNFELRSNTFNNHVGNGISFI